MDYYPYAPEAEVPPLRKLRTYTVFYHVKGERVLRVVKVVAANLSSARRKLAEDVGTNINILGSNVNAPQSEIDVRIARFQQQLEK